MRRSIRFALRHGLWRVVARLLWYELTKRPRRWWRRRERRLATNRRVWITADRRRVHVSRMDDRHLRNARALVERSRDPKFFDARWVGIFDSELARRGLAPAGASWPCPCYGIGADLSCACECHRVRVVRPVDSTWGTV